jgi:hypothetical protein
MAEHDLVDVGGGNPGVRERLLGDPYDQALDRLALKSAEGSVGPANDASSHDALLSFAPILRLPVPVVKTQHLSLAEVWPTLTCRILDAFFDHEQCAVGVSGADGGLSLLPFDHPRPR